jgi:hypothetical protein
MALAVAGVTRAVIADLRGYLSNINTFNFIDRIYDLI